ncbi:FAD-dependent thymidylate synthase [Pseudoalteromonas sp. THAF3]|uniref:FAD-dependent thymidylate synthase n=1 Tax=Pseudoalteromonas sp. THAF3 TaxID=2587843 RepID=UPI0034640CD2
MGDDLRVANVARVSFNKWKTEMDEKDVRLIDFLARHEHTSPFRHTAVTIRVTAPIWLARQLGKHQVGMSWNETSRRYVDTDPEFFTPAEWRKRPDKSIKQGSGAPLAGGALYEVELLHKVNEQTARRTYERMLELGVAPELARGELPQNMLTSWVWTGSLTSFFHCYRLRAEGTAQREAQDFAGLLDDIISPLFPHCWQTLKDN